MVNLLLTLHAGENQAHLKVFPVNRQLVWGVPHSNPPAPADCQRSTGHFHLTTSSPPWRRFFWSPWKTPISTWLHSLWNQFSLFCSYSPWVTMDTAPHWFDLSMNLFMSSNLEWKGMFFYLSSSQSKHDLLIGHSMKLHSNAFFLLFSDCRACQERLWKHFFHLYYMQHQLHKGSQSSSRALRKRNLTICWT